MDIEVKQGLYRTSDDYWAYVCCFDERRCCWHGFVDRLGEVFWVVWTDKGYAFRDFIGEATRAHCYDLVEMLMDHIPPIISEKDTRPWRPDEVLKLMMERDGLTVISRADAQEWRVVLVGTEYVILENDKGHREVWDYDELLDEFDQKDSICGVKG